MQLSTRLAAFASSATLLLAACSSTSTVSREALEAHPDVIVVPVAGAPVQIHADAITGDFEAALEKLNAGQLKGSSELFAEECRLWLEDHAPLLGEVTLGPSVRFPRAEKDDLYRFDDFVKSGVRIGGWGWHSYRWASGDGPLLSTDLEAKPGSETWALETLVSLASIVNGQISMQVSARLVDLRTGKKLAHAEPTLRTVSTVTLTDHSLEGTEESLRATARDLCAEVLAQLGLMRQS